MSYQDDFQYDTKVCWVCGAKAVNYTSEADITNVSADVLAALPTAQESCGPLCETHLKRHDNIDWTRYNDWALPKDERNRLASFGFKEQNHIHMQLHTCKSFSTGPDGTFCKCGRALYPNHNEVMASHDMRLTLDAELALILGAKGVTHE